MDTAILALVSLRRAATPCTIHTLMLSALRRIAFHPRARWLRWIAVLLLTVAVPATKHVVESIVLVVQDVHADAGTCDGCEDEGESDSGPRSCQHCAHCTPTSTPASAVAPVVSAALGVELEPVAPIEMVAAGYRSQPFRPPAA